jgi:hypothetical protein
MSYRLARSMAASLLLGCATAGAPGSSRVVSQPHSALLAPRHHNGNAVRADDSLPVAQLARAKRATARYRDSRNALADGYEDINVVIPNMGRHFLKHSLLDSTFEIERPEILVYAPDAHGALQLVALEYAVPESLSTNAPEGFQGAADHWYVNQAFGIWTLHAWIWKDNPAGVFYPTNPKVQ